MVVSCFIGSLRGVFYVFYVEESGRSHSAIHAINAFEQRSSKRLREVRYIPRNYTTSLLPSLVMIIEISSSSFKGRLGVSEDAFHRPILLAKVWRGWYIYKIGHNGKAYRSASHGY